MKPSVEIVVRQTTAIQPQPAVEAPKPRIAVTNNGRTVAMLVPLLVISVIWIPAPNALILGVSLTLAFAASHLFIMRTLKRVQGRWLPAPKVHANQDITIGAVLTSVDPIGPIGVALRDAGEGEVSEIARVPALGVNPTRVAWVTRFPRRGRTRLPPLVATCNRPFDLLRGAQTLARDGEVMVLPQLGKLRRRALVDLEKWLEEGTGNQASGNDEISHLRPYQPGDCTRRIHWRASARARSMLLTERSCPQDRHLNLVVDLRKAKRGSRRLERMISIAATLVDHFTTRGWTMALFGGSSAEAAHGDRDFLLEILAEMDPSEQVAIPALPTHQAALVLTLDGWDQEEENDRIRVMTLREAEATVHLSRAVK